jgi:alpha-glucosidase (family GH31 glycosyl hydrolase)
VSQDIFIKHANGGIFTGQVWPDDAAFPDYLNPKSVDWLKTQLSRLHDQVGFDGIWEDMNEASNFCNGVCYDNEKAKSPVKNKLPYIPSGRDLETKSISLDAIHSNGYTELDTHSLYGTSMVRATHEWFKSQNRRTMIIERSAYAGAGKFASRWLGDNFARQEYMGYSVTGVMAHNIIGIPLAGADICGFIEDTTPELCARWYTLGAFYPFSRNHNNWGQTPQEPWVFARDAYEGNTSFYEIIKIAMYTKMHMIRYYHTQLTMLNLEGGAFFKPLFFEFPDDALAYTESQEDNIMLGKGLKLSINAQTLDKNSTDFYIPTGTWCSVFDSSPCVVSTGKKVTLQTKAYNKYVHLRDGYIVPMQDGKDLVLNQKVTTTAAL